MCNEYKAEAGEIFYKFMERVKEDLKINGFKCGYATFNGIKIMASYDSCIDDLSIIYNLKSRLRQLGEV